MLLLSLACMVALPAGAQIRRVLPFRDNAANGDWSPVADQILFERAGDISQTQPKATLDKCLTCGLPLSKGARTSPVWHPSGAWFAFADHGIWFMDVGAHAVHQAYAAKAASDLRFSRDGSLLAWMEEGTPRMAQVVSRTLASRTFALPPGLRVEAINDFTMDARELLVTAGNGSSRATQIYACSVTQPACRQLTDKPSQHNDFARITRSGRQVVFASTDGGWFAPHPIDYRSDYWLLGATLKRMTWFNEPANPHYIEPKGARVTCASWNPEGRWLLATLVAEGHSRLVMIEFPEPE